MHKGSEGFMSDEQYRTFHWPFLRRAIEALVKQGVIPAVYCEGDDTPRPEYFAEASKGKAIFHLATMDMTKAKEMLGDVACISGNLPNRLLAGTPGDVKVYCRKLLDISAKGAGYIMDAPTLPDEAKPENVRAMFEIAKEYGTYG